ncbi:MAG: cysteine desulfurase family protein [Minisyncoccales bacterium]
MADKKKIIYLDFASTTPLDPRVLKEMMPYFSQRFGNSMSIHALGQEAKITLEECRDEIAKTINAQAQEIIFTSSATESNNLALKGIAFSYRDKGRHLIISPIEHESVLKTVEWLKTQGFEIEKVKVDHDGLIDLEDLRKKIKKETILVSIIFANNEIGTLQEIEKIGMICREKGVFFHTDAVQAFGKIKIDVKKMNLDLLSASAHKIYGPKGSAFLFCRKGIKITPLLHGGGQEFGLRSSTVNLPAIVGLSKAVAICQKEMKREEERLKKLKVFFVQKVLSEIKGSHLNGRLEKSLPHIVNFWFEGVEGESLVLRLDMEGICASTGSACSSLSLEPSHVLLALGLEPWQAHGSLRFSFGRQTKKEDLIRTIKVLKKIVEELREISPFKLKK